MNKSNWAAVAATTKESKYNSKEEKACLLLQFVLEINPGGPHNMQNEMLPIAVYSRTTQNLVCALSFSVIFLSGAFIQHCNCILSHITNHLFWVLHPLQN